MTLPIDTGRKGYERNGENHVPSRSKEEMERILEGLNQKNMPELSLIHI